MTASSRDKRPSRRRRFWQVVAGLSILAVVLVALASLRGGDGDGGGPLNAVAEAADKTQRQPGGRATVRGIVSSPKQAVPLTITGEIVFDTEANRAQGEVTFKDPQSGDPVEMEMVGDGTMVYMSSSVLGSLPDGRKWIGLDLSLGDDLNSPVPANFDPKGELELLASEAGDGKVLKLGSEEVHGVETTRYRGTVSVTDQVERLRDEGADDLASYIEEKGTPVRFEAWIDAGELVRRMRIVKTQEGEGDKGPETIDMRMDFSDFGPVNEIDVPDPDEVFDATSLAREQLELSNGD
jgi:hypothetical protein